MRHFDLRGPYQLGKDINTFKYHVFVNCPSQETEVTTRPVEKVALTTKTYRKENTTCEWDDGGKIGNNNK